MKTAFISDIHGRRARLLEALADARRRGAARVICLGDLVDGGDANIAVVRELRTRRIITVRGNHDERPRSILPLEDSHWLTTLPLLWREGDLLAAHISPRPAPAKVNTPEEAAAVFDEVPAFRILALGHAHAPLLYLEQGGNPLLAEAVPVRAGSVVPLPPEHRVIFCPGAIGLPRGHGEPGTYAILDAAAHTLAWHQVAVPAEVDREDRDPIAEVKGALRQLMRRRRRLVSGSELLSASDAIAAELARSQLLRRAGTIAGYAAMGGEPDVRPLLELALAEGRTVLLPRVQGETMAFHRISGWGDMVPGYRGILEPRADAPVMPLAELDVVLVPGLAFDRTGARLGRGGGFYDRLLHALAPAAQTIGVAHRWQVTEIPVPTEPHDRPVRWLATPDGLRRCYS